MTGLRRTPLYESHRRLDARMVDFAGFEMPVQYTSILEEHRAVRQAAGLFDVSHMGQLALTGPGAVAAAERLLTRGVRTLKPGRVRYALLCNEAGGTVDDVTVYRLADDALFLCVNAANVEKDYRWVARHTPPDVTVRNTSEETGLLALQGPASAAILSRICPAALDRLARYAFDRTEVASCTALVSRTGYTGSDGFELYLGVGDLVRVFDALLDAGKPSGLLPAGLGARDTLRLEAAMPLYGHELDDATSPLEAGLERFVELERGGFIGAEALVQQRAQGLSRRLVGFVLEDRGVARADHPLAHAGQVVGKVTSGAPSPTLGTSIGLGYVPPELAAPGTPLEVLVRGRALRARVVETPFVGAPPRRARS
jgi:aminomethyltransferase